MNRANGNGVLLNYKETNWVRKGREKVKFREDSTVGSRNETF